MNADKLTIPEGFSVDVGSSPQGWFAGVLVRPDRDKPFVEDLGEIESMKGARLKPGQTDEAWLDAMTGPVGLQVVLAEEAPEGAGKTVLTEGERADGSYRGRSHLGTGRGQLHRIRPPAELDRKTRRQVVAHRLAAGHGNVRGLVCPRSPRARGGGMERHPRHRLPAHARGWATGRPL